MHQDTRKKFYICSDGPHTHTKAFNSALVERDGLDFVTMEFVNIPVNMPLEVHQTTQGTTTKITPVTRTPTGMEVLRKRCDLWTFNNQGYLVRTHRTQRKALLRKTNSVQFQQKGWRTSEEHLPEEAMATMRPLKMHTKHSMPSNDKESVKENLGQEGPGLGL